MSEAAEAKAPVDLPAHTATSNAVNKSSLRNVRARVIELPVKKANGSEKETPKPSNVLPEEPFASLMEQGRVIEPPFDMLTLSMLVENSSELNQCIEAMEVNIEGYGHRFVSRLRTSVVDKSDDVDGSKPGDKQPPEVVAAKEEYARCANFFQYCTDDSFVAFRRKLRRDLEMTGNAYFEVLRAGEANEAAPAEICAFTHMPSYQMRLGKLDDDPFLVERKVVRLQADGSVKIEQIKEWKRFRRFIQSRAVYGRMFATLDNKVRWFKQFGDPRRMHKETGDFETETNKVPDNMLATEIIHLKIYSPRTPYGLPRYIGNLLSIFGDRAAEEINYITFRNNNIPSMVVCVSNGQLTEGTIQRIQSFVESQIQGSDNYSKFLIVEGEPFGDEGEDGGQVKIDIKPLQNTQQKDALFQNYSEKNQDKIRRAWRLPPIFVGRSDEYSRATAEASRRLADEQIFSPERNEFDELINRIIFPEMGVVYHKFKSNSPNTTDNAQLVAILAGAEKTGGMTPRIARQVLSDILGQEMPEFPEEFDADVPFSLTMAEAVKNEADATEPGQQVTAIKVLKSYGLMDSDGKLDLELNPDEGVEAVTKKLLKMTKAAERLWKQQALQSDE
jgi:PBSX family phage portal protein